MVFIDYSNLAAGENDYRTRFDATFHLDLIRLIQRLTDGRAYVETHLYRSSKRDPTPNEMTEFAKLVQTHKIHTHPFQRRRSGGRWVEKQVDVALAIDVVQKAGVFDIAVIVSGDEDLIPAGKSLRLSGKTVEIAAFQSRVSARWKPVAHRIWLLDTVASQIARPPS
jgi:uncharacterized LabA/DUF88 family protein